MEVSEFLVSAPRLTAPPLSAECRRIVARLDGHVTQFLEGAPWKPFHHTLGISGYEVEFNHPDEMFYALAIALPFLPEATAARARTFLVVELSRSPPYGLEGFDNLTGRPRESYDVPDNLRVRGRGKAAGALGVYAFWIYCQLIADTNATAAHWAHIKERMKPVLESDYQFDLQKKDSTKGEAQKLNSDLAGLIGLFRLARLNRDAAVEQQALSRARQLLELRINLERVNPHLLEKSNAATKGLHNYRLSRYCDLVPEVGAALARWSGGCGAGNLKAFREQRNGWFIAFGDRLIGGENYTNPLHFSRALFAGAAFIEQLPGEQLLGFIDVPWGKGDFYFIEKCVYALWAAEGRPWMKL